MKEPPRQTEMMMVLSTTSRLLILMLVVLEFAVMAEATVPAASTVVAGMVFCDQCKDGARGLFDYPLYGTYLGIIVHAIPALHMFLCLPT